MHFASLMQPFSALSDPLQQRNKQISCLQPHGLHQADMHPAEMTVRAANPATCTLNVAQLACSLPEALQNTQAAGRDARVIAGADEGALAPLGLLLHGRGLLLLLLLGRRSGLLVIASAGGDSTIRPRSGGTAVRGRLRRPVLPLKPGPCPRPCSSK